MKRRRELSDAKRREVAVEALNEAGLLEYETRIAELECPMSLEKYLADYIEHERDNNAAIGDTDFEMREVIAQGIDAYEDIFEGEWVFTDAHE